VKKVKRLTAVLLSVIMLLSVCTVMSFAEGTSFSIAFDSSATTLKIGETFTVNITATDITESSGIIGMDMLVSYDADKLEPISSKGIFPEDWGKSGADFSPVPAKTSDGDYTGEWQTYVLYDGEEAGHGVKANNKFGIALTFKVKVGTPGGETNITVNTGNTLTGTSDNLDHVMGKGGSIRLVVEGSDKLKLKATSSYKLENAMVMGVALGSDASTVKDNFENENIKIKTLSDEEVTDKLVGTGFVVELIIDGNVVDSASIVIKGDTDGTGKIDATDYLLLKRHVLKISMLNGAAFAAADVDGSGTIDATDYILIKRHILGISLIK
jgi:hypothetical protein